MNISIIRETSEHTDFQELVRELDLFLQGYNGEENDFYSQFNEIQKLQYVVVAYFNNTPVGCGAIKPYEQASMEIKRMYVKPFCRNKGIATQVLTELEKWAKELGYNKCILETGINLSTAISLYENNRYNRIPNYGQYEHIPSSICFEKML